MDIGHNAKKLMEARHFANESLWISKAGFYGDRIQGTGKREQKVVYHVKRGGG